MLCIKEKTRNSLISGVTTGFSRAVFLRGIGLLPDGFDGGGNKTE
jgi:hypothetical protein